MATKTAAKLRKKTAKARKRNARASDRQARLEPKRRPSPTDHLFWVEQGDDLISRTVPFSRQLNAVPPERASERGRWVARPHLRLGDVLLDNVGRAVQIVSLPADLWANPRVRPLVSSGPPGRKRAPIFCYWVKDGQGLAARPVVPDFHGTPPPGAKAGRWVMGCDLRLKDIVLAANGECQVVAELSDDPFTLPMLEALADCRLFWALSGTDLDSRPPRFDVSPPADATSGRWVARRHLRVGDVLSMPKGEAKVIKLPENVDDEPLLFYRCQVEEVFHHPPRPIMHVYFGGGSVGVTHEHPWYVKDKGWTASRRLLPGDLLMTNTGDWVPVDRTEDRGEVVPVYNLHVAKHHTYFVKASNGGPAVLVHNQSGGTPAGNLPTPGMPNAAGGAVAGPAGAKAVPVAFAKAPTADDLNKDWDKVVETVEKDVLGKVVGGGLKEWEKLPAADQAKLKKALKEALGAYLETVLGKAPNDAVKEFINGFPSLRWILDVDPNFRGSGVELNEVERKKKYTITLKPDLTVPNLNFKHGDHTWKLGLTITITW